jgi:hypothetical protein
MLSSVNRTCSNLWCAAARSLPLDFSEADCIDDREMNDPLPHTGPVPPPAVGSIFVTGEKSPEISEQ